MIAQSFEAVNRRIEEERRAKFRGTASVRLSALQYRDPRRDYGVGGSTHHVDAIERMFRQENGCRKEDNRHHVKALISPQMLEAAITQAGISRETLMSDTLPFRELEFDPGIRIECIEGHDRLAAADKVLYGAKTRWIVDLYLDDLSDDLRLLLGDGFDYQKQPDDGTYYVTIRSFQGHHGKKNQFFENVWLGRLSTNANKRKMFDQLSDHKILRRAFDKLLDIPGLFGGLRLGSIHHVVGMKCPELHDSYLDRTHKWWRNLCGADLAAMRLITREDVAALEGKAPGACSADSRLLFSRVVGGEIFKNFNRSRRDEMWSLVCKFSQQCLIPSLSTFFNDRKPLHDAVGSIKKLLDIGKSDFLTPSLQNSFTDANQEQDRCIVQLSETTFGSVAGDADLRMDLAIRQLWLAAFRNYTALPAEVLKTSVVALPRTKSDISTLYDLASLASRLGFESDKIKAVLEALPDRLIAQNALLQARKPGMFTFHDTESCIRQVLNAFAAATPVSADDSVENTVHEAKVHATPPKRCGRPNKADHEYDRKRLFLPQIHEGLDSDMGEMTSTFVRWSMYCAYFGTPPALGTVNVEACDGVIIPSSLVSRNPLPKIVGDGGQRKTDVVAEISRQQLELEEAKRHEADKETRQTQLDELGLKINNHNAELEKLHEQINLAQARLDELNEPTDFGHNSIPGIRDSVLALIPNQPVSKSPSPSRRQSSEEPIAKSGQPQRHTCFNFEDLEGHDPQKEHNETQDGTERAETVRIDFIEERIQFELKKIMVVDPALECDKSDVMKQATEYMRDYGYILCNKNGTRLNPTDCYDKVTLDGSHKIILKPSR